MKFEIMTEILFELLSKKTVTAKYLAEKYEVSVRSIYRYVASLESAGVPIYTARGAGGGISIVDTFRLTSTFMTEKEFDKVIGALTAIAEGVPDKTLDSAINKLKSVIKNEYASCKMTSGNLIIDASPWGDAVGYKSKLNVIVGAIESLSVLHIKYHDRNGTVTERDVEPHFIVFKQGLWYVYAFCRLRGTFRFFKIGRIENATVKAENFTRKNVSEADMGLDFWENAAEAIPVRLEISHAVVSDAQEWLGVENVKEKDGKFIAEAKLPLDGGLISKIMGFAGGVKVLSPDILKTKVVSAAKNLLNTCG